MTSIYDVDATELIEKLAEELKKIEHIKPTAWAIFVKTGMSKERPPMKKDWWYTRAASILRYVKIRGPIGVHKLRIKYGGKKNRGVASEHFYKASGNIIRKILQQLEKAELIKKGEAGIHKGRIITQKGLKLLNNVVKSLSKVKKPEKKQDIVKEITKEKKETTNDKVAEIVKKTKEFAQGKGVTAEKLVEGAKKLSNESENGLEMSEKRSFSEHAQKSSISDKSKTSQKEKPKEEPKPEVKKNG